MPDMSQAGRIRDMLADGHAPTEVKEGLGVSYPTIRRYASCDDFSPKRPEAPGRASRLDPYRGRIAEMLDEDGRCWHKQRHTAKRVYDRLVSEHGFRGSYFTVQRYVRQIRPSGPKDQPIRLGWDPGAMQADFGQADFDYALDGGRTRLHYLPMSFPYSNHEVCEVFADEGDVCVCQGLKDRFERMGGVPPAIVLDNATEAGRGWRDVMTESDLFRRLRLRYGFGARSCNPNAGKGRGSVEGEVGYTRRNFLVPVPEVGDLRDYNLGLQVTLDAHSKDRVHHERGLTWAELLEQDREHLLPLPKRPFDVVRWCSCTTDGHGRVTLDGNHRYLASPELQSTALVVGARAFEVEIDAPDGTPLRTYPRRTGTQFTSDEDPLALLGPLSMKARAFGQPSVFRLLDEPVRAHFNGMGQAELGDQVRAISRLAGAYGMAAVVRAYSEVLQTTDETRAADVELSCARIASGGAGHRQASGLGTKLSDCDKLMGRGGEPDGKTPRRRLRDATAR